MKFYRSILAVLVFSLLASGLVISPELGGNSVAQAQELTTGSEEATKTETTAEETASDESTDAPATDSESTEDTTESSLGEAGAESSNTTTAQSTEVEASEAFSPLAIGAILVALFVIPVLVGNWISKQVNLPDHGWKISLVLITLAAAGIALFFGEFKFGPDLAGGITLIYEIQETEDHEPSAEDSDGANNDTRATKGPDRELVRRLTDALKQRVDPTGTKEVTIRPYGQAIEIIIPRTGQDDLEFIKRRITSLGQLEFRITADPNWGDRDKNIIEKAEDLPSGQKSVELDGQVVAKWVTYAEEEFGPLEANDGRVVKRDAGDQPEALVLIDQYNVTGEYLDKASKSVDERGGPAVRFVFDSRGAQRFGRLTGNNAPNAASGAVRHLGIILDNRLLAAPSIREKIRGEGIISGGAMTDEEVEFIISVLDAGSLPAALNPVPLSEEIISSTLGAETVEKGKYAIAVSLSAVLIFMLIYYRFAGMVACLALVMNLVLVLGVMVLIHAAFTLPGLAGLVLTVGMSVDANVLIFERIREELARGSALRMAIRNGFGRATTTIVDANLTTLITGVVLYAIGTDQIKGFAVTLILGISMSMFTAIFCSRIVFDIAERRRWITKLSMSHIIGHTAIDFIGKRYLSWVFSGILIALGLFGVFERGSGILNIDFTGGTSVTMLFNEGNETTQAEVDETLKQSEIGDKNLLIVERGESKREFTVSCNLDSVADVEKILADTFAGQLKTYSIEVGDAKSFESGDVTGSETQLKINVGMGDDESSGIGFDSLLARVDNALASSGHEGVEPKLIPSENENASSNQISDWTVRLPLDVTSAESVLGRLQADMNSQPVFPLASKIGGKVAGNMQVQALYAILVSLLGIVGYLWLRFQKVTFGLAAVVALVHDVLVTLGMIAISAYIVSGFPALAEALQIDSFQISLPIVAAFMTIIGYSLNDTIVVFDRIREVRGKSPHLTADMVNTSINQTLSRTLLTSLTTMLVVLILYFAGGAGIHAFAFALVIGVLVGTYSSIFIASPALLAMSGTGDK